MHTSMRTLKQPKIHTEKDLPLIGLLNVNTTPFTNNHFHTHIHFISFSIVYNNLGILLYKKGEIREAGENLLEAFKMLKEKKLEGIGHNCVAYCRYVLGREELADKMADLIEKHKVYK